MGRFSILPYLGMKLTKDPEVVQDLGSLTYRSIFEITIFGYRIWPLSKVPEVAHILSFYSKWLKLSLIFALRATVSEILHSHFQNRHMWSCNLAQKLHIYSLSIPRS